MVSSTSTKGRNTTSKETANNKSSSSERRPPNSACRSHQLMCEPTNQEVSGESGRFNGSTQHQLEGAYLQEVQTPKSFACVDLNAALPCSVLIESSRTGRLPGGSIACYF